MFMKVEDNATATQFEFEELEMFGNVDDDSDIEDYDDVDYNDPYYDGYDELFDDELDGDDDFDDYLEF